MKRFVSIFSFLILGIASAQTVTNHDFEVVPNTPVYKDTGFAFNTAQNFEGELVSPEKIVKVGHSTFYNILGTVDQTKLKNYLSHFGYVPNRIANIDLLVGVTQNRDFVGCGCPEEFKEFSIMAFIKSNRRGTLQVAAMRFRANHPQRIASMGSKFGTLILPGLPHHEFNSNGEPVGFSLNDVKIDEAGQWNDSTLVLKAVRHTVLPNSEDSKITSYLNNNILNLNLQSFGLHSLGSKEATLNLQDNSKKLAPVNKSELDANGKINFENEALKTVFYRIARPIDGRDQISFKKFDQKRDSLILNKNTEIGKFLSDLGFKPKFWSTIYFENAFAWVPIQ